ncbi:MAG: hypothetical protein PF795_10860, partial [Kiritimatiellae bacterium]|nr:hypothetical protein [Kiritimatiellia bacterium]
MGIAIGTKGTAFNRIQDRLKQHRYYTEPKELPRGITPVAMFYKDHGDFRLRVDFLTGRKDPDRNEHLTNYNMLVPSFLGVERAFAKNRMVRIGTPSREVNIRVC